jgi:hypothetical protein
LLGWLFGCAGNTALSAFATPRKKKTPKGAFLTDVAEAC